MRGKIMRQLAVLVLTVAALCGGSAVAQAQTFSFQVCNKSSSRAWIAVAAHVSPSDDAWQAQGWWVVDPGACSTIGDFPKGWFYYYARAASVDWKGTGPDVSQTCVPTAHFKRLDPPGYKCTDDEILTPFNGKNISADSPFV